jgi:hypothetical protein
MGPHEQSIARQCFRTGEPLPDRIENAPELLLGLNLYMRAFFELDSDRNHVFNYERISLLRIAEYALVFEFDELQREDLLHFIPKMDIAYINRMKEKEPKK